MWSVIFQRTKRFLGSNATRLKSVNWEHEKAVTLKLCRKRYVTDSSVGLRLLVGVIRRSNGKPLGPSGFVGFGQIYRKTTEALRHNVSVVFYSSSQIVVCKVLLQQPCRLFRRIYLCASVSQAIIRTARSHANPPRFSLRYYFPHCSNVCSTFPISPSMQIACFWISLGQYASAKLIQA